jgi:hypothetical protein
VNTAAAFHRCLINLDVIGICDLWNHVAPDLPQPQNEEEAIIALHLARTQAESIPAGLRRYSHAWLTERNLPSQLPDELKPKPEQVQPRRVEAVGIAVRALSTGNEERARVIEKAMSNAVAECYATGETNISVIKMRMRCARRKAEA